jgi:hypothetical protein
MTRSRCPDGGSVSAEPPSNHQPSIPKEVLLRILAFCDFGDRDGPNRAGADRRTGPAR